MRGAYWIIVVFAASLLAADAQTNTPSWPIARIHALEKSLDIPSGASLDVGVGGVYSPSLKKSAGRSFGYMLVANYKASPDDILSYQIRFQHLAINRYEGDTWQPNGMITASKTFHIYSVAFTPMVELGAAFDSKFDPYGITGVGVGIGWHNWFILPAAERWAGPYNSFTTYNAVAGYHCTF